MTLPKMCQIGLQAMLDKATLPKGLCPQNSTNNAKLLLGMNEPCHIKQILTIKNGSPQAFINAFPAVNSPYGLTCQIERIIRCDTTSDAILCLKTPDGAVIYAFDQLYAVNRTEYRTPKNTLLILVHWRIISSQATKKKRLSLKTKKPFATTALLMILSQKWRSNP